MARDLASQGSSGRQHELSEAFYETGDTHQRFTTRVTKRPRMKVMSMQRLMTAPMYGVPKNLMKAWMSGSCACVEQSRAQHNDADLEFQSHTSLRTPSPVSPMTVIQATMKATWRWR